MSFITFKLSLSKSFDLKMVVWIQDRDLHETFMRDVLNKRCMEYTLISISLLVNETLIETPLLQVGSWAGTWVGAHVPKQFEQVVMFILFDCSVWYCLVLLQFVIFYHLLIVPSKILKNYICGNNVLLFFFSVWLTRVFLEVNYL